MRHAVRDVPQEELLAPAHAEVADHQHVDGLLLGGLHDGPGGIGVHHHACLAAGAGDLLGELAELGGGESGAGRFGRTGFRAGLLLRHQHLEEVQLRAEPASHVGSPIDRARGAVRLAGGHHDLLDQRTLPLVPPDEGA